MKYYGPFMLLISCITAGAAALGWHTWLLYQTVPLLGRVTPPRFLFVNNIFVTAQSVWFWLLTYRHYRRHEDDND